MHSSRLRIALATAYQAANSGGWKILRKFEAGAELVLRALRVGFGGLKLRFPQAI
jgi:hypothetical protein